MIWRLLILALLGGASVGFAVMVGDGCTQQPAFPDFGVYPPGCRAPSACYLPSCPCTRASLSTPACRACDPSAASQTGGVCDCTKTLPSFCTEEVRLCVGRGPACPGRGARCVPAGTSCSGDGGTLPELTASGDDGGSPLVPRCPLADDVCC